MTKSEGSLPREIVQGLVEKLEGYKPLVVLVEGMDNSGKTTLIRRLERMLCLEYIHSVYEPTEEGQAKFIEGVFTQVDVIAGPNPKKTGVVLDRISLVSELVYGPILRHGSVLQPRTHQRLLDKLWTYDPIIIYCRPTTETIISNIHEREQMAGVAEKAAELVVQYDNIMSSILSGSGGYRPTSFQYDYTEDPQADELLLKVFRALKARMNPTGSVPNVAGGKG